MIVTQETQGVDEPIREDRYSSILHPDVVVITRAYRDGSITIDLEGSNQEHLSAVETELKVTLMRKGMLGKLRGRTQVERS